MLAKDSSEEKLITNVITSAPMAKLEMSFIKPFPVKRDEAMGEKSVNVHASEIRKNSVFLCNEIHLWTYKRSNYEKFINHRIGRDSRVLF